MNAYDTTTAGAMVVFAKAFLSICDYSTPWNIKVLNQTMVRFMEILQSAPLQAVRKVLCNHFSLPIPNITICNVRIEAIALGFFNLRGSTAYAGKFVVWQGFMQEIDQYFKELDWKEVDDEIIDHILQCIYWPLVCPLTVTEVNQSQSRN